MSDPIPDIAANATTSGLIPVELYAGPLCGLPMMLPAETETIEVTSAETGEVVTYIASDLRSRKGCRVFQMQPEIPF
jgi:hypothetical protein